MAELHSVEISDVEMSPGEYGATWETSVSKNVAAWLSPAQEVLALPGVLQTAKREFDLGRFRDEWAKYMRWLSKVDDENSGSQRVFAHNDTQYGNLLRLKRTEKSLEDHRQVSWCQSVSVIRSEINLNLFPRSSW